MATATARHILVETEDECNTIKAKIEGGDRFEDLAKSHSKCPSGQQGGDLGSFGPGQMVKEFDDVVFGVRDTGEINMGNMANIFEPVYALEEVHGPVPTKFGYHLIKILSRNIADFDFRQKEESKAV